jgi:hypothetical protein
VCARAGERRRSLLFRHVEVVRHARELGFRRERPDGRVGIERIADLPRTGTVDEPLAELGED